MLIRTLAGAIFALLLPLNCAAGQPPPFGERTKLAQVDTGTQGGVQHHREHAHPSQAARPGYAGRPAADRVHARYPGFARRSFGGHFYHGVLAWDRGAWRHEWRNGRYAWWWDVGGAWYLYEQPVYPYPTVISDVEVLEDPAMAHEAPPDAPPPGASPVVAPAPVVVAPPPIVCVGSLCVR
jgi:hypothetical protein